MKASDTSSRRNLLIGTRECILAITWNFLSFAGNFVVAALLTQYYGLRKVTYGLLMSLPMWSNAAQIVFLPWLARFLTPKDLALGMGWLNIGMRTMLAAVLPYLPTDDATGVARLFIVFFVVASLSQAFLGVGWTSWARVWVPSKLRGKCFGSRNRWLNVGTVFFLLLALVLFEADATALWPYQVLIIFAVVARYGSLIWQHGIRTTAEHLDVVGQGWVEQLRQNLAAPGLVRFIVFAAPILAGLLLTHFLAAGAGITVYRIGSVVKSTALLAGILLLRGVREPQRATSPTLTGAFRTIRQLVAAQRASFLGRGG